MVCHHLMRVVRALFSSVYRRRWPLFRCLRGVALSRSLVTPFFSHLSRLLRIGCLFRNTNATIRQRISRFHEPIITCPAPAYFIRSWNSFVRVKSNFMYTIWRFVYFGCVHSRRGVSVSVSLISCASVSLPHPIRRSLSKMLNELEDEFFSTQWAVHFKVFIAR